MIDPWLTINKPSGAIANARRADENIPLIFLGCRCGRSLPVYLRVWQDIEFG